MEWSSSVYLACFYADNVLSLQVSHVNKSELGQLSESDRGYTYNEIRRIGDDRKFKYHIGKVVVHSHLLGFDIFDLKNLGKISQSFDPPRLTRKGQI